MIKPISSPNLPMSRVRVMAVSAKFPQFAEKISSFGITPLEISPCSFLPEPVNSHPDLLIHHLGGEQLCFTDHSSACTKQLAKLPFHLVKRKQLPEKKYPKDIGLNALSLGDYLIGKIENLDPVLQQYGTDTCKTFLPVKQGYTKCSCCVVNEKAVITSDTQIAKVLRQTGFDVLQVETKGILLPGYDCGFIGGCTGLISSQEMLFTGSLSYYRYGDEVKSFLKKHRISYCELTEGPLLDVGSLLPLCEQP